MVTMKRLFMLRHGKGGAPLKGEDGFPMYFGDKMRAKKARDLIGPPAVVSPGPDHKLYNKE